MPQPVFSWSHCVGTLSISILPQRDRPASKVWWRFSRIGARAPSANKILDRRASCVFTSHEMSRFKHAARQKANNEEQDLLEGCSRGAHPQSVVGFTFPRNHAQDIPSPLSWLWLKSTDGRWQRRNFRKHAQDIPSPLSWLWLKSTDKSFGHNARFSMLSVDKEFFGTFSSPIVQHLHAATSTKATATGTVDAALLQKFQGLFPRG